VPDDKIIPYQLKSFFFFPSEVSDYLEKANKVIKEKEGLLKTLQKSSSVPISPASAPV